jgi:nucleotide-binding universal stress UspA family protein
MGVDSIVVKDMAGILAPYDACELIRALRETVSVPIHLHTHYTSGMASMTCLKAIEAGAHVLDTCLAPFALRSSQPAIEPIVVALEGTEWDTGLDLDHLLRLGQYLEGIAPKYRDHLAKTGMAVIDTGVLKHQVPGGMLSNLVSQLKEAKALDRIQEVFDELPRTRKELGYPPLVTPSSQLVGIQAVENVLFGRYRMVPSQIKDYAFGLYGRPPRPVEPEVQRICLKGYERGEQPIDCRPADILEPELGKARQALKDMTEKEEDVLTYALFPTTGLRFLKWQYGLEKPPSEVTPKTLDDVRREDELIGKAKAGLLVGRADKEVRPEKSAVAVGEKRDGAETPVQARNVPGKDTGGEERGEGPTNILIAVDGSEQSFEAVRYVSRLFLPGRGNFTLLHIMDRVPDVYWDLHDHPGPGYKLIGGLHWVSEQQRAMEEFFEEYRRIFDEAGHPRGSTVLRLQEKKVGIARDIGLEAEKGYDALVVGRKGLSPLKDILFGGIADKLVSHPLQVPVWVVGGAPSAEKLLVAVDRSEQSRRTLDYTGNLLASRSGPHDVLLFNVIRGKGGLLPDDWSSDVLQHEQDWVKRSIQEFDTAKTAMKAFFEEAIRGWQKKGFHDGRIRSRISWGESRAGTIVDEARRGGYGTIVVGRKGLTRVEEFFMGRVSNKILQLATDMAVWVVH